MLLAPAPEIAADALTSVSERLLAPYTCGHQVTPDFGSAFSPVTALHWHLTSTARWLGLPVQLVTLGNHILPHPNQPGQRWSASGHSSRPGRCDSRFGVKTAILWQTDLRWINWRRSKKNPVRTLRLSRAEQDRLGLRAK